MKRVLAIFALAALAVVATAKAQPLWIVFLVKGEHHSPPGKGEAMQEAHIANFKRLFAEHKLLAAGPLQDPTEFRRGIVVLTVSSQEAVRQCFNTDPFVQAGIMHLEVYRWNADRKGISLKNIDPNAIEENRIVLLTGPETPSQSKWPTIAKRGPRNLGGTVHGAGELKEVRLYAGATSDEKIKGAFDGDTSVKAGKVRYRLLPLWMAKGTLKA